MSPLPQNPTELSNLINGILDGVDEDAAEQTSPRNISTEKARLYDVYSPLLEIATNGGYYAQEDHDLVWQHVLKRLAIGTPHTRVPELQRYPGTLLLYALGLGAVTANKLEFLGRIFAISIYTENDICQAAVQFFTPYISIPFDRAQNLLQQRESPIYEKLEEHIKHLIYNKDEYTYIFDKLDILMALNFIHHAKLPQGMLTTPLLYDDRSQNLNRILQEIRKSISDSQSPFVKADIFGNTHQDCLIHWENLKNIVPTPDSHARGPW